MSDNNGNAVRLAEPIHRIPVKVFRNFRCFSKEVQLEMNFIKRHNAKTESTPSTDKRWIFKDDLSGGRKKVI